MSYHDLVNFGGAFISLTSIHAVIDEVIDGKPTGAVHINYGHGHQTAFEGDAASVMEIINGWCTDKAWAEAIPPLPKPVTARGGW